MRTALFLGVLVSVSMLAPAIVAGTPEPPSPSEAMSAESRDLYAEGRRRWEQGEFDKAYASLQAAWSLKKHWQIAGLLGLAELRFKHFDTAATHLAFALRGCRGGTPEETRALRDAMAQALSKVARITVNTEPGATLTVNGTFIGRAPFLDPIFLAPGRHSLQVSVSGKTSAAKTLSVSAGQSVSVSFDLEQGEAALDSGFLGWNNASTGEKWTVLGLAGASLVTLSMGTYYGIRALQDASDEQQIVSDFGPVCRDEASLNCQRLLRLRDSQVDSSQLANLGLLSGALLGVFAVGTAFIWPSQEAAPVSTVMPVLSPGSAGLSWTGSF